MGATGGGATIVFATNKFQASTRLISVGAMGQSGVAVDDSDLIDSFAKFIAGDLITYEPIEIVVAWENQSEFINAPIYTSGSAVITIPAPTGGGTATTYTGTCFLTNRQVSQLANNERITVSYTLQPTGQMTFAAV